MKKIIFLMIMMFSLYCQNVFAASVFCKNCSTNVVQMLEKMESAQQLGQLYKQVAEAVKQTQHQLELVQTTFQQYQNMVQNTVQLPQSMINELKGKMTQLAQLTSKLKTHRGDMTYLGQIFNELFPGQEIFEGIATASTPEGVAEANAQYQEHWDKWSAQVDEAAQATFQLSGQQLEELAQNSGEFQNYLNSLLATPDGQMKAIMAGNQLSAIQIQEARQLRELIATVAQSNLQSQMKAEKESQVAAEQWRGMIDTKNISNIKVPDDPF